MKIQDLFEIDEWSNSLPFLSEKDEFKFWKRKFISLVQEVQSKLYNIGKSANSIKLQDILNHLYSKNTINYNVSTGNLDIINYLIRQLDVTKHIKTRMLETMKKYKPRILMLVNKLNELSEKSLNDLSIFDK